MIDKRYDKIIDMPHHTSAIHKPMPLYNRAAQFSPFAALTGYESVISDAEEQHVTSMNQLNIHSDTEDINLEIK